MRRCPLPPIILTVIVFALTVACERNGSLSSAGVISSPVGPSVLRPATPGLPDRIVTMKDACDPETFNAVLGAGACVRSGGVEFSAFIEQLSKHGVAGGWLFAPSQTTVRVGQAFLAVNRGGEVHTFTEVDEFGGGFVLELNELSNNPTMAPECGALDDDDFVAPGSTYREEAVEHAGVAKFQCCIHPWMRLEARVMDK
jgi:plastocyanin